MRICIVGKFPPIQGGVSARTYWAAHTLAARGHEVHVVTNAKEAREPFRMFMRPEDWARCEGKRGKGSVNVHWTDPVDRSQSYIPMASPFVSKLASVAASAHAKRPFDVIYSHYLEPYGVAGHLAAQMTGTPHVVRMAGSDAGRLWHHPQFEPLYDHVMRSAAVVIAGGEVARRAVARGVDRNRVAFGGGFAPPDELFAPEGPLLDLENVCRQAASDPQIGDAIWGGFRPDRPYFGVYGKLGGTKGSFALLAAMRQLMDRGLEVGLVALAHGRPEVEKDFRACAETLGLSGSILQLPFLPHWRVPEFLRGCLAVCCLEQDFPIGIHTPITPREVMLSGKCLVASTEVLRKIPGIDRLPSGYGCVAIDDVNDIEVLSGALAAIVRNPVLTVPVGARARAFALGLQADEDFAERLENILVSAVEGRRLPRRLRAIPEPSDRPENTRSPRARSPAGTPGKARSGNGSHAAKASDPLFRVHIGRWAMDSAEIGDLVPLRTPDLSIVAFDRGASQFPRARKANVQKGGRTARQSHVVISDRGAEASEPLLVDAVTAKILDLSDGSRTASDIVTQLDGASTQAADNMLKWIEELFVLGLVGLRDRESRPTMRASGSGSRVKPARGTKAAAVR